MGQLRNLPLPSPRISAGELPQGPGDTRRILGIERAGQRLLLGGVMPLWLGAGLADWYIHRRTRIEDTAGARESVIHSLMFAETVFGILPYAEELWRCWRAKPTVQPLPQPAVPATETLRIPPDGDTPFAERDHDATDTGRGTESPGGGAPGEHSRLPRHDRS